LVEVKKSPGVSAQGTVGFAHPFYIC